MYTMFSVAFKMIDDNVEINNSIFEKFKQFVITYNNFRNEFVFNNKDNELSHLYENIKKYKLASSEGINKISNRMIRFEILYKMCINDDNNILDNLNKISNEFEQQLILRKNKIDKLENDDLVDIDE